MYPSLINSALSLGILFHWYKQHLNNTVTYHAHAGSHSCKQEWVAQRLQVVSAIAEPHLWRIWGSRDRPPREATELPSLPKWAKLHGHVFWCHQQVRPGSFRIWVFFSQKCWEKVSVWQSIWPHHVTGKGSREPQLGPGWREHKTWSPEPSDVHTPLLGRGLWEHLSLPGQTRNTSCFRSWQRNQCSLDRGLCPVLGCQAGFLHPVSD